MNKTSRKNVYVMKTRLKSKIIKLDPKTAASILEDLHLSSIDTSKKDIKDDKDEIPTDDIDS